MARVKLSPDLPPRTPELLQFEKSCIGLNRFYWTYMCSLDVAMDAASRHKRVADFVPTDNWKQLDLTSTAFMKLRPDVEILARYSFLTQMVTCFEDYLASVLKGYLSKKIKRDKLYAIKIRLNDIPAVDVDIYFRNIVIDAETKGIIDAKYSDRISRIKALLDEHGTEKNIDVTMPDDTLLVAANETRHCIVHCSGVADARAASQLGSVFPGLKIGDRLPLDESTLRRLLGAVRDGARAVDVALRLVSKPPTTASGRQGRRSRKAH